jgi:1-acyl-sn-glycerol-3-phosphate acyltransferase
MDLVPHFAGIIAGPPIDAAVAWGECVAFDTASDRKAVTRRAQDDIRRAYARLVTGRDRD